MDLDQRAAEEAKRRMWLWILFGGGAGVLLPIFGIALIVVVAAVFLAGIGHWVQGLFVGPPPPMGTVQARTTAWLPAVDHAAPGLPNALSLAILAQASGGEVYGDRYYCVRGSAEQSAGEACAKAYGAGWRDLGEAYGLAGINAKDVHLLTSPGPHDVAWNLHTGLSRLATTMRADPVLQTALPAFHRTTQAPPGWRFSGYAATIRADLEAYGGPQMAAWAIAPWGKLSGAYQDPHGQPEWVLVTAAAPTGAPWTLEWRPPTVRYVRRTEHRQVTVTVTKRVRVRIPHTKRYRTITKRVRKAETKTVTVTVRKIITHNVTGRVLQEPVSVYATLTNGRTVPLHLSTADANVPAWPGQALWGGQFDLHQIRSITAVWAGVHPIRVTLPWPPASGQAVAPATPIPITQAVGHWWGAILAASRHTGVPAGLIAAIMLHESGGQPDAYNPQGPAYGLMQILPSTARGLPGYAPGWQFNGKLNLLLGAELLAVNYRETGSWRVAIAAYYGGLGTMEADGYTPGMPWSQAAAVLNVVPAAYAGNTETMTAYANQMWATSQAIAAKYGG